MKEPVSRLSLFKKGRKLPIEGFIGTFMGRDALAGLPGILQLRPSDGVLLPGYLCGEVVKPFRGKARIEFYDVEGDLSVDPLLIERKLRESRIKVVLIINYFGFLQPHRAAIKELCEKSGAVLVEDCAHSLLTEGSAETGDISIFSLRKHLPLPDGGGIKIRCASVGNVFKFRPRYVSNVLSFLSMGKSLSGLNSPALSRSGLSKKSDSCGADPEPNKKVLPLSSFAFNGFGNADLRRVSARCRADFEYWRDFIGSGSLLQPLFLHLPPGVCPLGFPASSSRRELVKERFMGQGILLKTFWKLPDDISKECKTSHSLAREVLALPTYPDLKPGQREKITQILKELNAELTPERHGFQETCRVPTSVS